MQTPSVIPKCQSLGEASAVNVEATGGRAHYIDGASEPYNGGTRHAPVRIDQPFPSRLFSDWIFSQPCLTVAELGPYKKSDQEKFAI